MAEIRNPNHQEPGSGGNGGDSRGMLQFLLLGMIFIFAYQYFVKPKQPPTPPPASPTALVDTQPKPQSPAPLAGAQTPAGSAQAPSATPTVVAPMVTETTVENENFKIVFTNQGAQVKHWILNGKQYKDHPDPGGKQLDLVNPRTTAFGLPLSLFTYEPQLTQQLNSALYQVNVSGTVSSTGVLQAPCAVSFHYAANGLDVVKTFRFDQSYVVTAEVEVKRNGSPVRALLAWPAGFGDQTDAIQFATGNQFVWSLNGSDDAIDAKRLSNNATLISPYEFAGVTDLYFAAAFLPDSLANTTVVTFHNAIDLPSDANDPNSKTRSVNVIGLAVGDTTGTTRLRFFAGPKQLDLLKSIHATSADGRANGPSLQPLIQYGWMSIVAKPLYLALRFLHDHLGSGDYNWGWSIIIFTALFNVLMIPTRFMALKSSLKMMRVQPKVDEIKRRYANIKATDPKRANMNSEMMELYKVEGVNMYGSCLPMLPQIPLFLAYFRVLQNAVELRQAHWFWLTDLSTPDPMHILPLLIILSMFFTQFITPTPGMDQSQRRMMAIMMPVMFGFMLWHYASGLALYWGTSNVINLCLQLAVNQSHLGKEMHAIAAKRAAKAASKTIQGRR